MRRSHAAIIFFLSACLAFVVPPAKGAPLTAPQDPAPHPVLAASMARDLQTLLDCLARQGAEVIAIQRELVSRPALGPEAGGGGEEPKANWIMDLLRQEGITNVERLDSVDMVRSLDPQSARRDVRPNIIARLAGKDGLQNGRTLWIICHMHVPPPGPLENWRSSPYALLVDGDLIYGRGVMDNYQSFVAALLLFESLIKSRVVPPMNLGLVLHAQNSGIRHVLAVRPELFKEGDLILVPDYGRPDGGEMGVAEKGLLWLKLTFTGALGHAAENTVKQPALVAGAAFITALPELAQQFPAENPLFSVPRSTFTPTRASTGDSAVNSVAASYVLHLDCRFVPGYTPEEIEQGVRGLADKIQAQSGASVAMERLLAYPALPPISAQSPAALGVARAVTTQRPEVSQVKPVGINTTTAASFFRGIGLPAVSWAKMDSANRHAVNESAKISDHLDEAKVFARILFDTE